MSNKLSTAAWKGPEARWAMGDGRRAMGKAMGVRRLRKIRPLGFSTEEFFISNHRTRNFWQLHFRGSPDKTSFLSKWAKIDLVGA